MSDGGKGSKPRPFSVTQEEYAENWNRVFKPIMDQYSGLPSPEAYEDDAVDPMRPSDYQDILSTEECMLDSFEQKNTGC
jgi:hypothetical protein